MTSQLRLPALMASLLMLSGCAHVSPGGRYFQVAHPHNGQVAFQFVFPTADGCSRHLDQVSKENLQKTHPARCNVTSASRALYHEARLRVIASGTVVPLEVDTMSGCEAFIKAAVLEVQGKRNLELVTPCRQKPVGGLLSIE
ncbi:MAG: hypothetical protein ACK4VX_03755 [Polaromonas sp.]